jgi:hypothetical protein
MLPPVAGVANDVFRIHARNLANHQATEMSGLYVPMYLSRIAPDKPGYDLRTFECPRCQNTLRAVMKLN